jgi:hypothetical protein
MVESNKERAKNKTLDTIDEEGDKPSKSKGDKKKKKPVTLDDSSEEDEAPKKEEKKSSSPKKEEPVQQDLLGDLLGMGDAPAATPALSGGGNDLMGLDFGSGPPQA